MNVNEEKGLKPGKKIIIPGYFSRVRIQSCKMALNARLSKSRYTHTFVRIYCSCRARFSLFFFFFFRVVSISSKCQVRCACTLIENETANLLDFFLSPKSISFIVPGSYFSFVRSSLFCCCSRFHCRFLFMATFVVNGIYCVRFEVFPRIHKHLRFIVRVDANEIFNAKSVTWAKPNEWTVVNCCRLTLCC